METVTIVIALILGFALLYVLAIWVIVKLEAAKKEREEKRRAKEIEEELKELAKWGVKGDQVYVIHGKLTMSIHGLIALANNPDYIEHLRKESLALNLHKEFFEQQLLLRIEKAKQRIQDRIDRLRKEDNSLEIDDKLKDIGIN